VLLADAYGGYDGVVAGNAIVRAGCWAHLRRKVDWKEQLLPKHPMAEAIKYALGHWDELNVFLADGAVAIDNNVSEREMKRVVLNRKNSLFVGNARGGRTAAILASLTSSCRRHDVDPQLYLTQLLVNLPSLRISDQPDWLPDRWKAAQNVRLTGFAQEREFAQ
jgi:Transposase IS66 family